MRRLLPLVLVLALLPAGATRAEDEEGSEPDAYIRMTDTDEAARLDVAVRDLLPAAKGPRIRLVGVCHVADTAYYEAVTQALAGQELVLFESVLPPGAGEIQEGTDEDRSQGTEGRMRFLASVLKDVEDPAGGLEALVAGARKLDQRLAHFVARALLDGWGRPIQLESSTAEDGTLRWRFLSLGADGKPGGEGPARDLTVGHDDDVTAITEERGDWSLQVELASLLGLAFQIDAIDYGRPGWRVSDLAIDQVREMVEAEGGDFSAFEDQLSGRSFMGLVARGLIWVLKLLDQVTDGGVGLAVKMMVMTTLAEVDIEDGQAVGIDPVALKVIIQDRNTVVLDDLERLLAEEPEVRSVAVLYGAGHMKDLERRIRDRFGYRAGPNLWLPAMTIAYDGAALTRERLESIRKQVEAMVARRSRNR